MECKKCDGKGYFCLYPSDIPRNYCQYCYNGEVPAYREFWLCKVDRESYAVLLRGKKHWYYYDAKIGGWFIVEAEVEPKCRMVQK